MCAVLRSTVLAWAMAGAIAIAAEGKATNATLPPDVRDVFEWYETLGYPKTASCKWIGVLPGEEVQWGDDPAVWVPTRAFLLSDDDKRFTVLLPDLRQRTFTREMVNLPSRVPAED